MLMYILPIPLGRARVIYRVDSSLAKQLFLNNACVYLTAFSEPRAHSECDRGQETLLNRAERVTPIYYCSNLLEGTHCGY